VDKIAIRLEFKNGATIKHCQEVLDAVLKNTMVKSAEIVINSAPFDIEEKQSESLQGV
jgi:hypothetical protein